jgi:hypothetical protein
MLALAIAALMTASGTAMAASHLHRSDRTHWSSHAVDDAYAQAPGGIYGAGPHAFRSGHRWDRSTGTASEPGSAVVLSRVGQVVMCKRASHQRHQGEFA